MFVNTKAAIVKNKNAQSHEHVIFHGKAKKTSQIDAKLNDAPERKNHSNKNKTADLKKLRFEIIKFGMTGFKGEDKDQANVALMVSLGAKRPKNKAKNYKELLLEKSKEKEKQSLSMHTREKCNKSLLPANKLPPTSKSGRRKKKEIKGLLDVYGKVKVKKKARKTSGKKQN